ncbi:hypothetical protein D7X96_18275 [Corallococcus interemptor]|uniref:Uncharacterized protein n=1 Tax=Corallococcus interemptor TaxID=2316720 RepID=A0A3A8QGY1_9BACT|nr:hypothetical protein [Corallococcus interemptor]RKH40742.1 hypothetical protein D7Y23_34220 [Corallococcus sp. AB050B]RKH67946.1 hypothetical protein D7X96_18275 [Corallococcus interemptor]
MSSFRALALLATLTLVPASALAEPEDALSGVNYVFATVDAYSVVGSSLIVTGTLVGESNVRTIEFPGPGSDRAEEASRCDRLALLTMTRPGRFHFSWFRQAGGYFPVCTLTRQ